MFDVTDKRAVDRLAAVVAMLEQREREARLEYNELRDQFDTDASPCAGMSDAELAWMLTLADRASARHTEAQSALAAARELATDR